MTLPIRVKKRCYVCKHISNQTLLASTSRFGAPDLDTRPPEMMRSSMGWWVQECPSCGFAAPDISVKIKSVTKDLLKSETYVSCSGRDFKNTLAEKFYKAFLIHVHTRQWEEAFYDILHTAWCCDDADDLENAEICRRLAIKCLEKLQMNDTLKTVRADLMRRAGLFSQVIEEYDRFQCGDKTLDQIVRFEVERARRRDTGCYTMNDIDP